jgi:hypothetical protein
VRGFAGRFASGFAQHAVKNTIEMGVGAWRHEDPRAYVPSGKHGVLPRMKYAAKNTFLVPRKGHSKKSIAAGRLSGDIGSGVISRLWQPGNAGILGPGLETGGIAVGADLAMNMAKEFIPRHHGRKQVRHHHSHRQA